MSTKTAILKASRRLYYVILPMADLSRKRREGKMLPIAGYCAFAGPLSLKEARIEAATAPLCWGRHARIVPAAQWHGALSQYGMRHLSA